MPKQEKVWLGVAGCGPIGFQVMYGPILKYLPNGTVTAFMDPNREAAEKMANFYGGEVYTDYDEFLSKAPMDAVVICSPVFCHKEQTVKAAQAGKHVLCEKPMARTPEECDEMIKACKRHKVILMVAFMKRFDKSFRKAKELIQKGVLGQVVQVRSDWSCYQTRRFNWRDTLPTWGGMFQDHGSHTLDLCRWWLGDIQSVSGEINVLAKFREVEDQAVALCRHKSGAISLHHQSRMTHKPLTEYYLIDGSKASLEIEFGPEWSYISTEPFTMRLYRKGSIVEDITLRNKRNIDEEISTNGRYKLELEHFCECVLNGKQPSTTGEDGKKAIEAIVATYLSSYKGEKIKLPLKKTPDLVKMFKELKRKGGKISLPRG